MPVEHFSSVNSWRGQCLDNFVRGERAILTAIEKWQKEASGTAPKLSETAGGRTRALATSLKKACPNCSNAKHLGVLLKLWQLREIERNELVHGCFKVKPAGEGWQLINQIKSVRKGVSFEAERLQTDAQAAAFLEAVAAERKALERALTDFQIPIA